MTHAYRYNLAQLGSVINTACHNVGPTVARSSTTCMATTSNCSASLYTQANRRHAPCHSLSPQTLKIEQVKLMFLLRGLLMSKSNYKHSCKKNTYPTYSHPNPFTTNSITNTPVRPNNCRFTLSIEAISIFSRLARLVNYIPMHQYFQKAI